ncbi:MAG: hypothetical protein ACYC27_11330 [Armatimonadota bacterium]
MFNAMTIGYFLFIIIPLYDKYKIIEIHPFDLSVIIIIAYISIVSGVLIGKNIHINSKKFNGVRMDDEYFRFKIALICSCAILFLFFLLFLGSGGFYQALDSIIRSGHLSYLSSLLDVSTTGSTESLGVIDIIKKLLYILFICIWVNIYKRKPLIANIMWIIFAISQITGYVGRYILLYYLFNYYIVYIFIKRPSRHVITIQIIAIISIIVILSSWISYARINRMGFEVNTNVIYDTVLNDIGSSIVDATSCISSDIHGDMYEFMSALIAAPIPRYFWENKPSMLYNIKMTELLTGNLVGRGNSIRTTTIIGEAWYYGGWLGLLLIPFMLGLFCQVFENIVENYSFLFGVKIYFWYNVLMNIRSTFLYIWQEGILLLMISSIVILIYYFIMYRRNKDHYLIHNRLS